jgi:hypothetical protein
MCHYRARDPILFDGSSNMAGGVTEREGTDNHEMQPEHKLGIHGGPRERALGCPQGLQGNEKLGYRYVR